MPTVHREGGFAFRIYVADHRPPHVHAVKNGTEVVIQLGDARQAPRIWERRGMTDRDAIAALRIVMARQEAFLQEWSNIHA
jgi:hypothetical protein